ncbi:MAG: hypothetical protein HY673_24480 [Chloroflexi bacterium]|nr:hypothetical protein [Chloroflexota bacterium]
MLHEEDIPPVNTVDKAVADPQALHTRMIVDPEDGPDSAAYGGGYDTG